MANIPNEPHKAVLRTAVGATVLIAVGAFVLSFAALTDLAQRSGIEPHLAWIWPIIVDGMIVASTVAIVALNGHGRRAMIYPWSLLFFGAIVSTAANSVHAILTVDKMASGIPPIVSALVAAMPPVVLLAITHLTVHMYQKRAEVAQQRAEEEAIAEAEAAAHGYYSHEYDGDWSAEEIMPAAASAVPVVPAAPVAPPRVAATMPPRSPSAGAVTAEGPAPLYDETVSALAAEDPEVLVQR
ncbi:DUF2637 domain-containing protein [Arthrobacter sp. VKM Ac-2550]|uniref:DUF2637 domain-containing protein n=1 Tax=Crystallibacter permensis TaxID=1938888 RepID=UPI002226D175|nr:DUF2637 domain-containing protein [Arthrobacter sp. VKM Ac-2550]MCW2134263.1 Protein of unknown function (DUF2637) [Arthrobacter sp. VKM Ac-2550]